MQDTGLIARIGWMLLVETNAHDLGRRKECVSGEASCVREAAAVCSHGSRHLVGRPLAQAVDCSEAQLEGG